MRTLTDQEKRTIRIASAAIAVYLFLFFGVRAWKRLEAQRSGYVKLVAAAEDLQRALQPYEMKAAQLAKLKETFHFDPQDLSKTTLVAQASAAIQNAALASGVQLGPVRESPGRTSSKELASMQLEASGPVQGALGLLHQLETLGFPLLLDSVQLNADSAKPGSVKLTLTVVIMDFEQWKNEEDMPHA